VSSAWQDAITRQLLDWGLRRFDSDHAYFEWQRQVLSPADLTDLHRRIEQKRAGSAQGDIEFYDATARSTLLPVLYSQRYEYYLTIGPLVDGLLREADSVLDFGCGPGILTTFYAAQHPDTTVVGIDRSTLCIEQARARASAMGLRNVRFERADVTEGTLPGTYHLVVASHALLQSEQDPGLPSRDWTTFERDRDPVTQVQFETRTGLGVRLDRLVAMLAPAGRMLVFEKTRQLARRVPFQRALAGRGLQLVEPPQPLRYRLVEEVVDDGPFYVLEKGTQGSVPWDEAPESDEGRPFDRASAQAQARDPDTPLYENHSPSAQGVWERLSGRRVLQDTTRRETDGRQLHVELGTAEEEVYLYCANTFDQRQLVIVERARAATLHTYYEDIIRGSP
jgi:SAM-dependent methyltransferase